MITTAQAQPPTEEAKIALHKQLSLSDSQSLRNKAMMSILEDCKALTSNGYKHNLTQQVADAWLGMLQNVGIEEICNAFKIYIATNEFFPSLFKIQEIIKAERLKNPEFAAENAARRRYDEIFSKTLSSEIFVSKGDAIFALNYCKEKGIYQQKIYKIWEKIATKGEKNGTKLLGK
jgi:hypothetical protein